MALRVNGGNEVQACGNGGGNPRADVDVKIEPSKTGLGRPQWSVSFHNEERQTVFVTIASTRNPAAQDSWKCGAPGVEFDTFHRDIKIEPGETARVHIPAAGNGVNAGSIYRVTVKNTHSVTLGVEHGQFPGSCVSR